MSALIAFWSHALAAVAFAGLAILRLGEAARRPGQRLLLSAFALTACWAWLAAVDPGDPLIAFAESARNLVWIALLYSLATPGDDRQHGIRLVYAAVSAVIGMQLIADSLMLVGPSGTVVQTALILRITAAAGALVLVHNVYGQAAPASRSNIRLAMLGLAMIWVYDLNFYTIAYLGSTSAVEIGSWRGLATALTAPLFALGLRGGDSWRIRVSRAATFQSLSLLAICAYFALMAIVATALRGSSFDWPAALMIAVLAAMTVGGMAVLPSGRARGWLKVKLAKHLFEHRYDYRAEWLRFTETLGRSGIDEAPLAERIIKAFADIADAPGGLLLVGGAGGALNTAAAWNWPGDASEPEAPHEASDFWTEVERSGRVLELEVLRQGWASSKDRALAVPGWLLAASNAWACIPLVHHGRLVGIIVLAAPEYLRALDWEDFDLLRTAGRQAASALAEAQGQDALAEAQRFEEFNRRFAFILHDIKNLISQLSLVARNSERHADNPDFRADMIATLKSSVGKMNELLARLAPHSPQRVQRPEPQPLQPILGVAIAAKRGDRDVRVTGDASLWAAVDPDSLIQALEHLLQNAVEASPGGGPVTADVSHQAGMVAIAISDRGVGMDSEFIRNRLFQPFVSTKPGGFGIGAFEARALVAAMGGRIGVDSRPGEGATFTIHLPAAEAPAEPIRKRA